MIRKCNKCGAEREVESPWLNFGNCPACGSPDTTHDDSGEIAAAESLELYVTTSDSETLAAFDFAFKHAARAVDRAARALAKHRAEWHDDPENDPAGYSEFHAPAGVQFPAESRAAVVVALFERCERIRRENIGNQGAG